MKDGTEDSTANRWWPAEQLVLAAQNGDPASIAAVVSASHPHAQRFARSLCSSPEDAEDAAQDAVMILFRSMGSLRATGALASWLYQVVRHECLRRWRRAPLLSSTAEVVTTSAEDDVLHRLEVERVAVAIAGLPPDLRRILILRDVQGFSGRAVADALGISVPAMKSRLHRARHAVRTTLNE